MTFKVGDRVTVLSGGDGVVTYGPVSSTFNTCTMYVVRPDGGEERTFKAGDLTAAPKFAVGDEVRSAATGVSGPIVAGPFIATGDGERYWIVEQPNGRHSTPREDGLTKVAAREIKVGDQVRVITDRARGAAVKVGDVFTVRAVGPGEIQVDGDGHQNRWYLGPEDVELVAVGEYVHDGVTYDLSARYRDAEGDVWRFERQPDGAVRGMLGSQVHSYGDRLSEVVATFGPLTKE